MTLVHLTSSTFFGGPERQMLGLAAALPPESRTIFASFAEGGRCESFLGEVRRRGFAAHALAHDTPHLIAAVREVAALLRTLSADVLFCHGYKAILLGRLAARRAGVPAVAVSRGWTGETPRVRAYEWAERRTLRLMDRVVCVSEGQAAKVRRWCRVPDRRLVVIPNAARLDALNGTDPDARGRLFGFFPPTFKPERVILAAGRLSPEKGFAVLADAAARICRDDPAAGVVLFGDGVERETIEAKLAALGLRDRFVLPGFRPDLDALTPAADVVVLPSFTEGLPNVALEASAAGLPVVATAVGGTPEVVADGETGYLVPPGKPDALAARIVELLRDAPLRRRFGDAGRRRMHDRFTFAAQAAAYGRLFASLRPAAGLAPV